MKRILSTLATLALVVGFGGVANAQDACSITGTGQDSNNNCNVNNTTNITYTCTNGILINNTTGQAATSGTGNANNNTTVGGVNTGTAVNDGQTTTDINASCATAATTTPTTPTTTPVGGMGSGAPASVTPRASAVAALPNTGNNKIVAITSALVAILGTMALATKLAIAGYRRI